MYLYLRYISKVSSPTLPGFYCRVACVYDIFHFQPIMKTISAHQIPVLKEEQAIRGPRRGGRRIRLRNRIHPLTMTLIWAAEIRTLTHTAGSFATSIVRSAFSG